jgi:hypothetical protein
MQGDDNHECSVTMKHLRTTFVLVVAFVVIVSKIVIMDAA